MAFSRFPAWVYRDGQEPDPRFSLANERTFLAWIRTSLALVAAGVAVEALPLQILPTLRVFAAAVFLLLGLLAGVQSWLGWARAERSLRLSTALPGSVISATIAVGVVVGTVLVGVGLLT